MNLARKKGPKITEQLSVSVPRVNQWVLPNGIPVFEISSNKHEVFKVEAVHQGGRIQEDKRLVNRVTSTIMKEGTENYPSKVLADKIDFYGATLSVRSNMDNTSHTLYGLTKYADVLLPMLGDIIHHPVFDPVELDKYIKRNVTNLGIELRKNDVVAYRELTEDIFGGDHPYGFNSNAALYRSIVTDDLIQHFHNNFGADNCSLFLSGDIDDKMRDAISRIFGNRNNSIIKKPFQESIIQPTPEMKRIKIGSPSQSAIIIGRKLFSRNNVDYPTWVVLNTVLGGYFGSRLMKSIREEKGLTYNISSFVDTMRYDGHFYITCEVAHENVDSCLQGIFQEIEKLKSSLIPTQELTMVKNYINGNILNMLDGPFKSSKWIKSLYLDGLKLSDGMEIIDRISGVTAEEIRELAQKYLAEEVLNKVIVS